MAGLVALHRLAAARGDGLHPRLLALLEERARLNADPRVVRLDAARHTGFVQAGPCPRPPLPDFLPGNVVGMVPPARGAQAPRPQTIEKGRTSCTSP